MAQPQGNAVDDDIAILEKTLDTLDVDHPDKLPIQFDLGILFRERFAVT